MTSPDAKLPPYHKVNCPLELTDTLKLFTKEPPEVTTPDPWILPYFGIGKPDKRTSVPPAKTAPAVAEA